MYDYGLYGIVFVHNCLCICDSICINVIAFVFVFGYIIAFTQSLIHVSKYSYRIVGVCICIRIHLCVSVQLCMLTA